MDVLEKGQEDLIEDFLPELLIEVGIVVIDNFKEDGEGFLLDLAAFLHNEICQVGENGKPQALKDAVSDLGFIWLGLLFNHRASGLGAALNTVGVRIPLLVFKITLVEVYTVHSYEAIGDFLLLVQLEGAF